MRRPSTQWKTTRLASAATLLGALLLGGCATTHVGNAWQCPLFEGEPCRTVREADPAAAAVPGREIPVPRTQRDTVTDRSRSAESGVSAKKPACTRGCRPLDWLKRAFGFDDKGRAGAGADAVPEAAGADGEAGAVEGESGPPPAGLPPAGMGLPSAGLPSAGLPPAGRRTPEVLGRIWIAPYVDVAGAYHEGSWVRVVIEPAAWRTGE